MRKNVIYTVFKLLKTSEKVVLRLFFLSQVIVRQIISIEVPVEQLNIEISN